MLVEQHPTMIWGKKTAIPKSNIIGDGIQPTYPHLRDTMGNTSLVAPI